MSISGSADASSTHIQTTVEADRGTNSPRTCGDPHPHEGPSLTATQQRDQPAGEEDRGRPVDPARRSHRRLGNQKMRSKTATDHHDHRNPEQPVVVEAP